jgi:sarcosine oxidase subunit alpha
LQSDVTAADIQLAAREGYLSVEHLKRYTATGMGADQGKTSNLNALATLAALRGVPIEAVGTTTFRPPYTPVTFGAIAGQSRRNLFEPLRKTQMHAWHESQGAVFECAGDWLRPWAFPKPGEDRYTAVQRESKTVRSAVGLFDASTLGKIDIQGPDAVTFLNRVYTNEWSRLPIGTCRYGLMLDERGMIFDDGVTTRLGENHFHMTTTSGGAARVMAWLEEWLQTEWQDLAVYLTSVTEQWAAVALNGPSARNMLRGLTELDLDGVRFPFMSCQEGVVAGVPARIFRISFSGELSYEINVPARYGLHLWEALVEHGRDFGLCVYGTEALHILRAERGFIVVGQDTDGTVTPMDLGMDWIVTKAKSDFIGRRSFACEELRRAGRKQLVGLLTEDPTYVLPQGVHLVEEPRPGPPMKTLGHVTSSYMSPNLGRSIALALVEDGRRRIGNTLKARTIDGRVEPVKLTVPAFLDPEGTLARG